MSKWLWGPNVFRSAKVAVRVVRVVPLPITVHLKTQFYSATWVISANGASFFEDFFYLFIFRVSPPRHGSHETTSPREAPKAMPVPSTRPTHKADLDSDLTVNALGLKHAASNGPETLLDLCFKPTQRRYGCCANFVSGGVPTRGGTDAWLAR